MIPAEAMIRPAADIEAAVKHDIVYTIPAVCKAVFQDVGKDQTR